MRGAAASISLEGIPGVSPLERVNGKWSFMEKSSLEVRQITCKNVVLSHYNATPFCASGTVSEFFRIFEKLDNALEQTAGATAVNAAMIEAQCDLRSGLWNEFIFCLVP
jgi:hypothetical protein